MKYKELINSDILIILPLNKNLHQVSIYILQICNLLFPTFDFIYLNKVTKCTNDIQRFLSFIKYQHFKVFAQTFERDFY